MRAIVSQGWSFIFVFQLLTRLLTGNLEDVDGEHEDNQACPVWVDKRKAKAPDPGPGQRGRWWPWGRGPSPPMQPQGFPSLGSPNGAPGLVRVVGIRKWKLSACGQPISRPFPDVHSLGQNQVLKQWTRIDHHKIVTDDIQSCLLKQRYCKALVMKLLLGGHQHIGLYGLGVCKYKQK